MKDPGALNILHADMDAFYAAVEVLDNPSLRGRAVIVGGSRIRGVVCSATYEARKFGVRSAMSTAEAARLCPHGDFVPVRMERYVEMSRKIQAIFRSFTPAVEPLSLDEAFLDVAGCERLHGDGPTIGRSIKARVRGETGLVVSVGVSYCKFLAKVASDLEKPDGFTIIARPDVERILSPLPIGRLWGVGAKTEPQLVAMGLKTIGDVRRAGEKWLTSKLGDFGAHLSRLSLGDDDREVVTDWDAKSIGAERTFERDLVTVPAMERELLEMVDEVASRLRADRVGARTISIKVRFSDFRTITRRRTIDVATDATQEIWEIARGLLREKAGVSGARVRLLGVQAQGLAAAGAGQRDLFGSPRRDRERKLDRVIDAVRQKMGDDAIVRARVREGDPAKGTGSAGGEVAKARRRDDREPK